MSTLAVLRIKAEAIENVVEAIEAFTDAKIQYDKSVTHDAQWANSGDVNQAREHMRDKLTELMR